MEKAGKGIQSADPNVEKTEATLKKGIDEAKLFHFIIFFPFQSGSPPKWPKCE